MPEGTDSGSYGKFYPDLGVIILNPRLQVSDLGDPTDAIGGFKAVEGHNYLN